MTTPELPPLPKVQPVLMDDMELGIIPDEFRHYRSVSEARERILLARVAANDDALSWVGELMAVMHADGGHYLAKHGMEKAIGDAMDKYHAMHRRIAELEAALKWIATVNAMDYEYVRVARAAIDAARGAK